MPSASISLPLVIAVEIADPDPRRALDFLVNLGDRQTALVIGGKFVGRPKHFRICESHWVGARVLFLPLGDIENKDTLHFTNLGCGEANAWRRIHRLQHVVHERADLVIDGGDGLGSLTKPFVWQNEDRS